MRFSLCLIAWVFLGCLPLSSSAQTNEFENAPGWEWLISPVGASNTAWSQYGVLAVMIQDKSGAYTLTIGWRPSENTAYRAVAFDGAKRRYLPDKDWGVAYDEWSMHCYRFASEMIAFEDVAHVGFEMLPPEGWIIASKLALGRARKAGIEVLPYPRIDRLYEFELTTIDGSSVRSKDLRGKVVVIDCWATWCMPCMKKLPHIQEMKKSLPGDRFEVVGINFDIDFGLAKRVLEEKEIHWPTVHVPADRKVRDMWFEVSSIRSLPRYLLLDDNGYLKLDTRDTDELERAASALLERK